MWNVDDVLYHKNSLVTRRVSYILIQSGTKGKQNVKKTFSLFDDVKNDDYIA